MAAGRSTPEWDQIGTDEWDPAERWESPVAIAPAAPEVSSLALEQPPEDPQPFNPNYQLQTGMTDWINVRALGAKGDGVTDDLGIFQAANLIAQQPPGRMIYIPAGTYKLSSNVVFTAGVQWLNMGTITGSTLSGGTQVQFGGATGMLNPMSAVGDLIVGGAAGSPGRIPIGAAGTVLKSDGTTAGWQPQTALVNPMTTLGDLIVGGASGTPGRIGVGGAGQVLGVSGGTWAPVNNPAGFANPMTTPQDLIVGGTAGAAGRLAASSTNGACLQVVNGAIAWATMLGLPLGGPSASQPVIFGQPDGTIVVLPLSTYSLTGDDSTYINQAFTLLPQITGGGGNYGGSYNGPWIIGTVQLLPADYTITTGIVTPLNSGATINLLGHGPGTRLLVASGATGFKSHVAMGGPQAGFPAQQNMGRLEFLRFDGSAGAACGVEIGGGWGRTVDVACCNFNAAGAIGLHLVNATNATSAEWTEKCRIRADLLQNTIAVVIENTSANSNADSFEYNDFDFYIIARNVAGSKGMVLQGGAYLSGGSLRIRGNFPANSGPVVTIQNGGGGSGNNSQMYHQFLDWTVESNSSSNQPQTVLFGAAGNKITNCTGLMTFQFTTWVPSNAAAGQLSFGGVIDGDSQMTSVNTRPNGWI